MKPRSMVSFCKKPIAKSIAAGLLTLAASQAHAVNFDSIEIGDYHIIAIIVPQLLIISEFGIKYTSTWNSY